MTGFTEDELIAALRKLLSEDSPGVHLGLGDDAALVSLRPHLTVLTTDLLVEGIHFERDTTSAHDLGYKALVVNVSDVAAMAGSPRYALVSLALPQEVELAWVVELYAGLRDAAAEYAVSIVGGDTSRADRLVLSVAVVGEVPEGGEVTRSGAVPGNRVVVTGELGAAAGGLRLAVSPKGGAGGVTSPAGRELLSAFARPRARVGEGQTLARAGATAMMDISDGLAIDLGRLCGESRVGAAILPARVPVAAALVDLSEQLAVDPVDLAMTGGEDYELLATLPAGSVQAAAATLSERYGTPLTDIGEIRAERGLVAVGEDGSERPLEAKGWDHFARP